MSLQKRVNLRCILLWEDNSVWWLGLGFCFCFLFADLSHTEFFLSKLSCFWWCSNNITKQGVRKLSSKFLLETYSLGLKKVHMSIFWTILLFPLFTFVFNIIKLFYECLHSIKLLLFGLNQNLYIIDLFVHFLCLFIHVYNWYFRMWRLWYVEFITILTCADIWSCTQDIGHCFGPSHFEITSSHLGWKIVGKWGLCILWLYKLQNFTSFQ
jgi:hypothetical protein